MFDIDKEIRKMLVDIIEQYTRSMLLYIAKDYNLNEEKILETYLTPYYYMPVIERDLKILNID